MEQNHKETSPATKVKSSKNATKSKSGLSKKLNNISISILTFLYKHAYIVVMFVATLLAVYAKTRVIEHPTKDVVGFIFKWMDKIIEAGHSNFYLVESDYSPIYLFFVNLLSMIPKGEMITVSGYTYSVNWITALKTCYFVFDLFNALAIYLIIHHATRSKGKATAGFLIMTALPIQFINSAIWGQADCIYTCFLLYSLYFALRGKSNLSFLMFGFALANKLQAVFLAPFLVYMILYRKIKFSSIIFTPIAVLSSFIPAYVCGASFTQPFTFYVRQFTGYTSLTSECPTFWQLFAFRNARVETVRPGVVYMALLFIGVLFAIIWLRKVENTKENLLNIAAFLACATVFFLPYMHDRYFYLVDILVVLYAVSSGRRYSLIPLMQIASGMAYYKYISGKYFFDVLGKDSVHIPAFIVLVVMGILLYDILHAKHRTLDEVLQELKAE